MKERGGEEKVKMKTPSPHSVLKNDFMDTKTWGQISICDAGEGAYVQNSESRMWMAFAVVT